MANQYQKMEINCEELLLKMKQSKDIGEYRRLQAVYLRGALNEAIEKIATLTNYSPHYVRHLHIAYKNGGIAAILSQQKGGRFNQHLTLDEEEDFIKPFIEKANSGGILEIGIIHKALEERLKSRINRQVVYNILHRHGWRKIAPRPRHPKADLAAQEAFKKTGKTSLKKPVKPQKT
jgi:transposase